MLSLNRSPSTSANPWTDDAQNRAKAARAIVATARTRAANLAPTLPRIKAEVLKFAEDLAYIEAAYAESPGAYRRNRALTAVHLPGIITSLQTLSEMHGEEVDDARLNAIEADIVICLAAAAEARDRIQDMRDTDASLSAATLRDAIAPESSDSDTQPAGFLSKFSKSVAATANQGATRITSIGSGAIGRVGAGTSLASTFLSGLVEDGVDLVKSPIVNRASAISQALTTASAGAIVGGIVSAVIFPPAVPFAVGIALLEGASRYSGALDDQVEATNTARNTRKQARANGMAQHSVKLFGRDPVLRLETDHIHVAINQETGQSQGIILTGKYAGESFDAIDNETMSFLITTAPDTETMEIMRAWTIRQRADSAPDNNPSTKEAQDPSAAKKIGISEDIAILSFWS